MSLGDPWDPGIPVVWRSFSFFKVIAITEITSYILFQNASVTVIPWYSFPFCSIIISQVIYSNREIVKQWIKQQLIINKTIISIYKSNMAIHTIKLSLIYFVTITLFEYFSALLLLKSLGNMKKSTKLKNPINYFIHKIIHHSAWYCWVTKMKAVKSIFFSGSS